MQEKTVSDKIARVNLPFCDTRFMHQFQEEMERTVRKKAAAVAANLPKERRSVEVTARDGAEHSRAAQGFGEQGREESQQARAPKWRLRREANT